MALGKIYEEGHADLFPFHLFMDQWARKLSDKAGANFKSSCAVLANGGVKWYSEPVEQTMLAKELLLRLMDENLFEVVDRNTRQFLAEMNRYITEMEKTDFVSKTNAELVEIYRDYCSRVVELNSWGTLVTLMEMGHESVITDAVYSYLSEKGRAIGAFEKVPEALAMLCSPVEPTYLREKRVEAIKLALVARQKGFETAEVKSGIAELQRRFCWVSYGYTGPTLSVEHFENEVAELAKHSDLDLQLSRLLTEDDETKKKQNELELFFNFDDYGKRLFNMARTFMFQKEYRKQVLYHSFYVVLQLRKEIAKRAGVALTDLAYALPEETEALLLTSDFDTSIFAKRCKLCVYLPFESKVLVGREAEAFTANISDAAVDIKTTELRGQCAFAGSVIRGVVRVVLNVHDLSNLRQGEVLVSPATSPAMVAGMKIAGAIVTDQGGLTCHAAIVSRELKKPCVIGTKVATKVFKDGDLVEVDSMNGIVRKVETM